MAHYQREPGGMYHAKRSTPHLLGPDDGVISIDRVKLKNGLGQIQADRGNIHGGWSFAGLLRQQPTIRLTVVRHRGHPPHQPSQRRPSELERPPIFTARVRWRWYNVV